MDVHALKQHIIDNPDHIETILEKSGFHNVTDNYKQNEFRAAREEGRNPTSVRVSKDTLSAMCFSTNLKGDLITLVQAKLDLSFPKTINKVSEMIGFKLENKPFEPVTLPFGGYYKKISRLKNDDFDLETYSDDILSQYEKIPSLLFYEDGILPSVQMKYQVGYDSLSSRIVVPWWTFDGRLCGIMGRLNKRDVGSDENKWFPILPFPKSKTLYGFVENYHSIQDKGIVMIGESEKFSQQLASKGLNIGLSLGGSFLSEVQANNIKSLFPKKIIVAMDEGLEEDHSRAIAEQLKMDKFYKNIVGYIHDKNNAILPKGSKLAPSDLNKNDIKKLIENCTIWV